MIYILLFLTTSFIPNSSIDLKIDKVWKAPYSFSSLTQCSQLKEEFKDRAKREKVTMECIAINKEVLNGR